MKAGLQAVDRPRNQKTAIVLSIMNHSELEVSVFRGKGPTPPQYAKNREF